MASILAILNDSKNSFEGMEPGEKVLLLTRRHPFFIIMKTILIVVLVVLPLIVAAVFSTFLSSLDLIGLALLVYSLWCLLLWQVLFYSVTMYILDVWVVTDKRIIDSTQHGFFNRSVSELHLSRVQDISVKVDGLFQSILKFGDLVVQTAGTENKFDFRQIPNPNEVRNEIMRHISENVIPEVTATPGAIAVSKTGV